MGCDQRRSRRLRGDRGTALIESAIVLPFLALMVFGIVEIGFLYRSASVVNAASRSGARLAAAQFSMAQTPALQAPVLDNIRLSVEKDLQSKSSVDTPVDLWVFKTDSNGDPSSGCGANCFQATWNSGTGHFNTLSGSWPTPDGCGQVIDSIGVLVHVTHAPIGFSSAFGNIELREKTVMRLEPRTDCTTPE